MIGMLRNGASQGAVPFSLILSCIYLPVSPMQAFGIQGVLLTTLSCLAGSTLSVGHIKMCIVTDLKTAHVKHQEKS